MGVYKNNKVAYALFLIPALAIFMIFMIIPVVQSLYYGFLQWDGVGKSTFIGFANYKQFFNDEVFGTALRNSIYLLLSSVFGIIPIAFLVALALNKKFRLGKLFKSIIFIPAILSAVIVGLIFTFIYNPQFGLLNGVLSFIHLDSWIKEWLADPKIAIFSVLLANMWQYVGYVMIILLAGLQNISNELLEAAEIDGASRMRKVFAIIIPLMKESFVVTLIIAITGSLKGFDLVYIMTMGGPFHSTEMLATHMYNVAFKQYEYGYGSAISNFIFVLGLLLVVFIQKTLQKDDIN